MKRNIKDILKGVVVLAAINGLWSCTAENPFENEGEGTIRLHTVVNAITTRSDENPQEELRSKCVVYISSEKGLIYKKVGLQNVDPQITLKAGNYVAEAWTGDSVSASFDKKFFRGYEPFVVNKGSQQNITLNCKIQNVVASINTTTINSNLMKDDYTITIKNSRGEVVFTKDNAASERGYFMMPDGDTTLSYKIEGSRQDGEHFEKEGTIENVQRAHHYILNFEYNPEDQPSSDKGAVFIKIHIKDETIQDSQNVTVHSRPTITGVDCRIDKQLVFTDDNDIPESITLQLCGFKGLKELAVTSPSASELGIPSDSINLYAADANKLADYKTAGLVWTQPKYKESTDVATAFLTIPGSMIRRLSTSKTTEHVIRVTIKDGDSEPQATTAAIRIARNESAIIVEDPIVLEQVDPTKDFMSITACSAIIPFSLAETFEGTPGVEYSKADEDNWIFMAANKPAQAPKNGLRKAQQKYTIKLTGLEPGTEYQYRACCGDFHSDDIMTFRTEAKFILPYADMETWNSFTIDGQKNCTLPGTEADEFWGNGNPGAAKAGVTLTQKSSDMFHSQNSGAKLRSQKATVLGIGKFAAGNLFTGKYVETDGTDGVLEFGRPYNGSHPTGLKVWVNYRPGTVEVKTVDAVKDFIQQGDIDKGQIYWALTTAPIEVRTKTKDQKLFNADDSEVLAYGQFTFEGNYGNEGSLQELIIPIEYKAKAQKEKPTHLVIVCSASKYGDYFIGGEGSTMYVDDFELIYE